MKFKQVFCLCFLLSVVAFTYAQDGTGKFISYNDKHIGYAGRVGTNDSWLVNLPAHEQFKKRFGGAKPSEDFIITAYASFIKNLRARYPKAKIICCLGNMDITKEGSAWPGYVDKAVAGLNDKNISTHFFRYKNTLGHPKWQSSRQWPMTWLRSSAPIIGKTNEKTGF